MKKRLTMLLATLMLLLPACGQGAAEGSAPLPPRASNPPAQTNGPTQTDGELAPAFDPTATLEETVLVDEDILTARLFCRPFISAHFRPFAVKPLRRKGFHPPLSACVDGPKSDKSEKISEKKAG